MLKKQKGKKSESRSVFSPNAGKYGPGKLIRTLSTQCKKYIGTLMRRFN